MSQIGKNPIGSELAEHIWEGVWGPGSVGWELFAHCVGEAMDHEQTQGAALLLLLLHFLWLLPHSWTAPQGMRAPPLYFHSGRVIAWGANSERLKKSPGLCAWWEVLWESGNQQNLEKELLWMDGKQCQACFISFI